MAAQTPDSTAPSPTHDPVPSSATWRRRSLLRWVGIVALVASAATLGWTARALLDSSEGSQLDHVIAAAFAVAGMWALLTATAPRLVTLEGSILSVRSHRGAEGFDLADPAVQIDVLGHPRSRSWKLIVHRLDGSVLRLDALDVDAPVLDRVVVHYRTIAERRRTQRWSFDG